MTAELSLRDPELMARHRRGTEWSGEEMTVLQAAFVLQVRRFFGSPPRRQRHGGVHGVACLAAGSGWIWRKPNRWSGGLWAGPPGTSMAGFQARGFS